MPAARGVLRIGKDPEEARLQIQGLAAKDPYTRLVVVAHLDESLGFPWFSRILLFAASHSER